MHEKVQYLAGRRARVATWIRGADEQLLRLIRESIEEEGAAARKYRRQIRGCLHHLRIIVRIYLDNTFVGNLHDPLAKIREIRDNLVNLDRSLRLDDLRYFLRLRWETILLRQPRRHPLELRQLSVQILETLRFQLARSL